MKIQIVNNEDPNMYDTEVYGKTESVHQRINASVCNVYKVHILNRSSRGN